MSWGKEHEGRYNSHSTVLCIQSFRVETGKYSQERKKLLSDQNAWEERNKTLDLAEAKNWSRCPKCAHIVLISVRTLILLMERI